MKVYERVNSIDEFIADKIESPRKMRENDERQYYAMLAIAAVIQEQTEVIRELKDKISDIIRYRENIYGEECGALMITGGLNTYEQN